MTDRRIPDAVIEELRARLPIQDVVGRLTKLRRSGRSWRGRCVFCDVRSEALVADPSPDKRTFHCFACGAHGDILTWLMRTEGCSFRQAVAREGGAGRAVLQHLMGSRVALRARSSDQVTVQSAIEDAAAEQHRWRYAAPDGPVQRDTMALIVETRKLLGSVGLSLNAVGASGYGWPWPFDGPPEPGLLIACELPSPGHLFAGSAWKGTGWRDQLKQLAGVRVSRRVMKFPRGGPSRAVFVPFELLAIGAEELTGSG